MIAIDRNKCVGCGHCQAIRMTQELIREKNGVEFYADPREEDRVFVDRAIAECWAHCIYDMERM